jgi:F-type H+/Na+-transporting ATPase subunit alpha
MDSEALIKSLKSKIAKLQIGAEVSEVGTVVEIGDGIARMSGLTHCQSSEMLEFPGGVFGLALNLDEDSIGAIILGDFEHIKEGDTVKRTGKILSIPAHDSLIGRVIDPLGNPLDGKGELKTKETYPIERIAPGVMSRQSVSEPVMTGIKTIDAMIPIGRGQRELIIGDRQTGKTAIAVDSIINQAGKNMTCIYVAIGQKESKVARIIGKLKETGALDYTIVVVAGVSKGASLSYIAPYAGAAIAEYFMDKQKDVLVVYDDLSKHAVSYREISLLLRRPPGREAFPGDVFYLHSRLLERSCRRNKESGGGSITALPIIETQAGDISAYIPTNVISITDGQIYLQPNLFYKGIRPAIDLGLSVSRVGSSAQIKSMKKVAGKLKLAMAQFRELEAFAQFASDLDEETRSQLDRGIRITELLKQSQYEPIEITKQVAAIYAANNGYIDKLDVESVRDWESKFYEFLDSAKRDLLSKLVSGWDDSIESELKSATEEFMKVYKSK